MAQRPELTALISELTLVVSRGPSADQPKAIARATDDNVGQFKTLCATSTEKCATGSYRTALLREGLAQLVVKGLRSYGMVGGSYTAAEAALACLATLVSEPLGAGAPGKQSSAEF